jgi:hypothetical protein
MLYYHDKANRTVYALPDEPNVHHIKGKRGEPGIWKVWTTIEVTRADNYIDPRSGRRTHDLRYIPRDEYLEYRDTKEDAVSFFKSSNYPHYEKITAAEYVALVQEYEAESNKGPKNA